MLCTHVVQYHDQCIASITKPRCKGDNKGNVSTKLLFFHDPPPPWGLLHLSLPKICIEGNKNIEQLIVVMSQNI